MKKALFICLVVFGTYNLSAQQSKFSIGLGGSYDFNLTQSSTVGSGFFSVLDIEHKNGFSAGITLHYVLSDRFKLFSGATLGCRVYEGQYNNLFALLPFDPSIPNSLTDRARFIQVPLMVGFNILKSEKVRLIPTLGAEMGFFIHETYSSIMQDGSTKEVNYFAPVYNTFQLLARFDLVLEVPLNERLFISAGPQFRYGILNTDEDQFINNAMILGAAVGINYKL